MNFILQLKKSRDHWQKLSHAFTVGSPKHTEIKGIVAEYDQYIAELQTKKVKSFS